MKLAIAQSTTTPEGPDTINITSSVRGSENASAVQIEAQAGNITGLSIFDERLTQAWQGYYGNITGEIALDDTNGVTFYSWDIASPTGEVYAVNGSTTPRWTEVHCINTSQTEGSAGDLALPITRPSGDSSNIDASLIERKYGINTTDEDGLNETYGGHFDGSFVVANVDIDSSDGCEELHPYSNSAANTAWDQVLLSDNSTLIFTAIIRDDETAWDNSPADFQLMVLENGHIGSELTVTTYYFYVELA